MSAGGRPLLFGPLPWAAVMVAIGFAIEALGDGDVPWIASTPLVLLLALALALARGAKTPT